MAVDDRLLVVLVRPAFRSRRPALHSGPQFDLAGSDLPGHNGYVAIAGASVMMSVPTPDVDVPAIDQVGLVVRDLVDGMDRFGAMLGIDEWAVFDFEPPALEQATYRGEQTEQRWQLCLATVGELDVELIEPIEGENSYTEHLAEHGEGLHHVACFSLDDPAGVVESYTDAGLPVLQSGVYKGSRFWYVDLREEMNGVIFEVVDTSGEGAEPDRIYEP